MDSILSRLSGRGKLPFETGSTNSSDPIKRRSSSVRSRKSISSLFKWQESTQEGDCQERAHYPMYDPRNPEHHGTTTSSASPDGAERTTPKKSRLLSIAQGLQDTLRAKAAYFYVQRTPDRPDTSPTSSASKKTVRFREEHFSIDDEPQLAKTWLAEDTQYSPGMLQLSFSQTSLLPMTACPTEWDAQKDASTTPSPRPSPVIFPSPVNKLASIPGTISLLDDPFNDIHTTEKDAVKALGLATNQQLVHGQVSASRVSSENHYADSETSRVRPSLSRAESSHFDTDGEPSVLPMSRQAVHGQVRASRVFSENHYAESESSCVNPSPSRPESLHSDTDGGTSVLSMSRQVVHGQLSTSRLSSENHYADSESSSVKPSLSRSRSPHSGTDEETSVLTDIRYSTAMAIDNSPPRSAKSEHIDYPTASLLVDKPNSLLLHGFHMEGKQLDMCESASNPLGQENGLVASRRERNDDAV